MNDSTESNSPSTQDQESPADRSSSPSLGKRLLNLVKGMPVIVTGVATVVTASATIIGVVASHGTHHQPGPNPSPSSPSTPITTASATATTAQPAPTIYWGPGALLISTNMDFDTAPPTTDNSGDVYFSSINAGTALGLSPNYGTKLALWSGADTPGPQQCLNQVETQSSQGALVRVGADICILTPQDRVVLVQVTSIDQGTPDIESRTTVWTMPIA